MKGGMKTGFCPEGPRQDPSWQEELDRIAPPNGKLSFLHLYWEQGYEWEPVGRWMVGQVIPSASIPDSVRELLEGPNPADHGHFEQDDYGQARWVTHLPGVTRRQWHFYHDTGNHLRPYWVVQGSRGGHRVQFNFAERRVIDMNGGDPSPPTPGDLPYSEPNTRTFSELGKRDLLRNHAFAIDFMENAPERMDADEQRGLEEMRKMLWDGISDQVGGYADEMAFHLDMDAAPTTEVQFDKKLEEQEHSFITQGA